jgi:hypothetical protein
MEKENTSKTDSETTANAAAGGTSCHEWCMSCLGSKDFSGEIPGKLKDFCKGMPDPQKMEEIMRTFFHVDKKAG